MKKRIMLAALCLSLSLGSTPLAAMTSSTDTAGVQRVQEYVNYGNRGSYRLYETAGYWVDVGTADCKKLQSGIDIIRERPIYGEYRCSSCGFFQPVGTTRTERTVVCSHQGSINICIYKIVYSFNDCCESHKISKYVKLFLNCYRTHEGICLKYMFVRYSKIYLQLYSQIIKRSSNLLSICII